MGWPRNLAVSACLILLTLPGFASAAAPQIPPPIGPVTDLAGILEDATRQELTRLIREVEERTTAEIAILTIPSTQPETIEEYSVAVFEQWKIGKRGKDNGLLFLVAVQDRRMRITTGYGLEGILPDGKIGAIRDREILPYFRAGRYAEGVLRGSEALASVILADAKDTVSEGRPVGRRALHRSWFQRRSTGFLLGIFIRLMDELAGTENRLSVERKRYNDAVQVYNVTVRQFPGNLIASVAGFKEHPFFEAPSAARQVPQVKF